MSVSLSKNELKLVIDAEILLTKNRIIQKVYELFRGLCEDYEQILEANSLDNANLLTGKISRGENYKGLPYVILDYPRQFGKLDVFAIRTFFWWGHFFSITLQLSGEHLFKYAANIDNAISKDLFDGWFVSCGESPWEHHFDQDNYLPFQREKDYHLLNLSFLKIAKKIPLGQWDEVENFLKENFTFFIKVLSN